nr:Bro-N domain-containing protein [Entomospira culicis]
MDNVRTIEIDGETWFVIADICKILDLQAPHIVTKTLDEDDRSSTSVIDKLGREQTTNICNESGLYQIIFQSRKPEAKKFKKWVTQEVLPTIRKKGYYGTPKVVQHDYVRRYNENYLKVDKGYFSVISELYVILFGFLEHQGFTIPEKDTKTDKFIQPDNSVGMGFSKWLQEQYPKVFQSYPRKDYKHKTRSGAYVNCFQYPREVAGLFSEYVHDFWLVNNAPKYLGDRVGQDLKAPLLLILEEHKKRIEANNMPS